MFDFHHVHAELHAIFRRMEYAEPPFSVSRVMETMFPEVEVVERAMREHARLEVYARPRPDGRRAQLAYRENAHHSTQRFSIAHELAHWIFDADRGSRVVTATGMCWRDAADKPTAEIRADYFASEMVAPLWVLHRFVTFEIHPDRTDEDAIAARNQATQRLASRFNVSRACMARRVFDLHSWRQMSRGR